MREALSWGPFAVVALREIALRFTDYHNLLLGSMLVIVVLAAPAGLAGAAASLAPCLRRIAFRLRPDTPSGRHLRVKRQCPRNWMSIRVPFTGGGQ